MSYQEPGERPAATSRTEVLKVAETFPADIGWELLAATPPATCMVVRACAVSDLTKLLCATLAVKQSVCNPCCGAVPGQLLMCVAAAPVKSPFD